MQDKIKPSVLKQYIQSLKDSKNYAYYERNQLVAALSKLFPAWREKHPESDTAWEDDWRNIIFIELPTGQASWHIHDSELTYFLHLPQSAHGICSWDGHTNEEKYKRLQVLYRVENHLAFIKRWVQRVHDNETTLEEFYGVLRYYEPLKPAEAALASVEGV